MYRTANEAENRRGLVLGLTLAELLLLLLFMLMLALAWRISEAQRVADAEHSKSVALSEKLQSIELSLAPLMAELSAKGGLKEKTASSLVDRLNKLEATERALADLRRSRSELMAEYMGFKATVSDAKHIAQFDDAIAEAAKINPNDPPEALARAVEVLKTLGSNMQPDDARHLIELKSTTDSLQDRISAAEEEREKYRRQVINLSRSGNGLTYPSCWVAADGQTQYIFDVSIRDDGVMVSDATPERLNDPQMKLVGSFARGQVINEHVFYQATVGLFEWSQGEKCRFYSIIRDATGPTSKQRYKDLRTMVEGHFYPLLLNTGTARIPKRHNPSLQNNLAIGGPYIPVPRVRPNQAQ